MTPPVSTFNIRGVFALDVLSHTGSAMTVRFRWTDHTAPTRPTILKPSEVVHRGSVIVRWRRSADKGSGVKGYILRLDGEQPVTVSASAAGKTYQLPVRVVRGHHRARSRQSTMPGIGATQAFAVSLCTEVVRSQSQLLLRTSSGSSEQSVPARHCGRATRPRSTRSSARRRTRSASASRPRPTRRPWCAARRRSIPSTAERTEPRNPGSPALGGASFFALRAGRIEQIYGSQAQQTLTSSRI